MSGFTTAEITAKAREIISLNPGGIRFTELRKQILALNPETNPNTINGYTWDLHLRFPNEISKPSRGLFMPGKLGAGELPTPKPNVKVKESDFYESFSTYLKADLDEVIDSIALGGASMGQKWGTPDVVGVYKPTASNLIRFQPEIVAAEIKIDPKEPVVAFGQAMAYRLFSAKTYVVMPKTIGGDDLGRLEALCMLFGVGLVLFTLDVKNPDFEIRVRAQRFSPDMFYLNVFADRLKQIDLEKFNKLFS